MDVADMLVMMLQMFGHGVQAAYSGQTALETAVEYQPDFVLLDNWLAGYERLWGRGRLRQKPQTKDVRLFSMTGYGQDSDRQRSQEAGFDHHLVKPADPPKLQDLLATRAKQPPSAAWARAIAWKMHLIRMAWVASTAPPNKVIPPDRRIACSEDACGDAWMTSADAKWIRFLRLSPFEMPIWNLKNALIDGFSGGQYVDKKTRKLPLPDGKKWEATGKPLKSLGGCNFRKGKYLRFCRESVSQRRGRGFESHLLHQSTTHQRFSANHLQMSFPKWPIRGQVFSGLQGIFLLTSARR
jgi:CheY-like chemotaxis protein